MFRMLDEPAWSWPVTVRVPADGGDYAEQRFQARFRMVPTDEAQQLLATDPTAHSLMERVLIGWSEVVDEAGAPVPFSPEMRDRLLGIPFAFVAIAGAYAESVAGAARKN